MLGPMRKFTRADLRLTKRGKGKPLAPLVGPCAIAVVAPARMIPPQRSMTATAIWRQELLNPLGMTFHWSISKRNSQPPPPVPLHLYIFPDNKICLSSLTGLIETHSCGIIPSAIGINILFVQRIVPHIKNDILRVADRLRCQVQPWVNHLTVLVKNTFTRYRKSS